MDETIEAELKKNFTQDQIDTFYVNFPNNFKELNAINPDAVDILFSALNFPKFKELMLQCKKGMVDDPSALQQNRNIGEQGEELFWNVIKEDINSQPWRKSLSADHYKKEGYKVDIWQRPCDNSPVDLCQLKVRVKDAKIDDWFETLKEGPPMKMV